MPRAKGVERTVSACPTVTSRRGNEGPQGTESAGVPLCPNQPQHAPLWHDARVTLTLRALLEHSDLHLRVVVEGSPGRLDSPIAVSHTTDLVDPSPYLEGGEVVLTTGSALAGPQAEERCRELVDALDRAGASALGVAIGETLPAVPSALADAAKSAGIALFEVPDATPLLAVSHAVASESRWAARERLRTEHRQQRQLIAGAATTAPTRALVDLTAEMLGGWAALTDENGRLLHSSRPGTEQFVRKALGSRAIRMGEPDAQSDGENAVLCYPLPSPTGRPLGHLTAGVEGPAASVDPALVSTAATLLALAVSRTARADQLMGRLRGTVMRRLLDDHATADGATAKDVWGGLPNAPILVAKVSGSTDDLMRAQDALDPWLTEGTQSPDPIAFGEVGEALWIVMSALRAPAVWQQLESVGGLIVGASRPGGWDEIGLARAAAGTAWRLASDAGSTFTEEGERSPGLVGSLDADALLTLARERLTPLLERHGDDVAVLRAWLRRHGQYDPAAKDLGIHRHTLRRRIDEIADALGMDLDSPTVRAELWLACAALEE